MALLTMAVMAGGCARTYHWAYQYEPRPVTVSVTAEPASEAQPLLVTVTVIGVRTDSAKEHPATIEVRMRVENQTAAPVAMLSAPMVLRSADLEEFGPPMFSPTDALDIPPGQESQFTAYFPFRSGEIPGGHDLEGLSLQWTMRLGEEQLTRSMTFSRREPARYYDDPGPHFGVGVHYHFFHHGHRHHRHRHRHR